MIQFILSYWRKLKHRTLGQELGLSWQPHQLGHFSQACGLRGKKYVAEESEQDNTM